MRIADFTENPDITGMISALKQDGINTRQFSDVLDTKGNQYVELVQEGGGVLGVALTGYTYVLEQMGIRFIGLAGTSAGSINAMMLAGLGDISQPKTERVIGELVKKNLFDFVDGSADSKKFIKALLGKTRKIHLVWKGWQIVDDIFDDLGLNPGDDFTRWLTGFLNRNSISNQEDLNQRFGTIPAGLHIREGISRSIDGITPRIAVIAADVTTETKTEFPAMAMLYWKDPGRVNPALYVRASMSIPYFFRPFRIGTIPQGDDAVENWARLVKYRGPVPRHVYMVDGGIMSNFPINVFHRYNTVPRMPTFGVRLGDDRQKLNKITTPLNLFGSIFNSIRHLHDYDFILKHPDYSLLIGKIDVGSHDWLDFALTDDAKFDLFKRGAEGAAAFLRKFDWNGYKSVRAALSFPGTS